MIRHQIHANISIYVINELNLILHKQSDRIINIMMKFSEIIAKVKDKAEHSLLSLQARLIDPHVTQNLSLRTGQDVNRSYLHTELPRVSSKILQTSKLSQQRKRQQHNASQNSLKHQTKITVVRKASSSVHNIAEKQLQRKREQLMQELKQIDLQMKNKHKDEYLQKSRKNKTESQYEVQSFQRAAKLVDRMNKQRKQLLQKKRKEALILKNSVQESIKRFHDMQVQKKEQLLKKKLQIERRIEDRKNRAYDRDKINKLSNIIIKELNSYKVSLPDIYFKKAEQTILQQGEDVMLTNLEENSIQLKDSRTLRNGSSRVTMFLENIHKEQINRKKEDERIQQYRKQIRDKHIQYGKKLRLSRKNKQKLSKNKGKSSQKQVKYQ